MNSLLLIAAIFLLAGFVKGVIGMGLPTVAVGVLGLMMPPSQAAAVLILPSLVTNIWQGLAGGHFRDVARRLWPMLAGICVGTWIGAVYLPSAQGGEATIWLGLALVVYAGFGLCNIHLHTPQRHEGWIGAIIGVLTGMISLATAVFAIPGVPYIQSLGFDRDRLVQALGLSFTTSSIALAAALSHSGEMNAGVALPTSAALVTSLIGMVIGQKVRGLASPKTFRLCFFIGLLALGAHLALHGLL
ncbi:MAG TPA: sulfite exporter TauE/SafE family protein [Pseudolabrys sp.]|nr:sulfite exporter TauE/SafE family protein [Pseudolabrys sp.]